MKLVCIVTNYNYAPFLTECLDSLSAQTQKLDRIVIVDDGSSDGSREIISGFCRENPAAIAITKENGGQLSCFNAALDSVAEDDLVFLIDADDLYPSDYVENVVRIASKSNAEYIFVSPVPFSDGQQPLGSAVLAPDNTFAFASTSALTRRIRCCIGLETSALCLRGSLFRMLLPYPYERDWITQADDLLTIGASIVGAHKLYIESLGISYRLHGANAFARRRFPPGDQADKRLRRERIFQWYCAKVTLPLHPPLKNALQEAVLIPRGLRRRFGIPSLLKIACFELIMSASIAKVLLKG